VTISELLLKGEIDAFMGPRPPSKAALESPNVGLLFRDSAGAATNYYKRTGIFPIMHLIGVKRTLAEQHPWLPAAVLKAFEQSKAMAVDALIDPSATKVTLPFVEEQVGFARKLMGDDFWPYGIAPNRKALDAFLRHHFAQGLSPRLMRIEEMFHPGTHETFKI
jgi:4,5-dihydroxyphthalate decarboxylase